jgi:Mor family transcriptional regulator
MRGWHTAKLTPQEVAEILVHADRGANSTELAFEYNVSRQHINRIKRGYRWGNYTGRGTDKRRRSSDQVID